VGLKKKPTVIAVGVGGIDSFLDVKEEQAACHLESFSEKYLDTYPYQYLKFMLFPGAPSILSSSATYFVQIFERCQAPRLRGGKITRN